MLSNIKFYISSWYLVISGFLFSSYFIFHHIPPIHHNCFNPLQLPSHCSPDLYNGIWLLTTQKRFNSAKFQNIFDNFSESSQLKIRSWIIFFHIESGFSTMYHQKFITRTKKVATNFSNKLGINRRDYNYQCLESYTMICINSFECNETR